MTSAIPRPPSAVVPLTTRDGVSVMGWRSLGGALVVGVAALTLGVQPASAAPPDPVDGGNGTEWRQLYETTGLSWNQLAGICPRDGVTPCSGSVGSTSLTGWVWATDAQVVGLMGRFAPAILTAQPPTVAGPEYFLIAGGFLGEMRWTTSIALTYFFTEAANGWTSSTDAAGEPLAGTVAMGFPPASGTFTVGAGGARDDASSGRGAWLWRPSGVDHSPPAIAPIVDGVVGDNGWFVSDVSVGWDVRDDESPIAGTVGCDPATVTSDTAGADFSCQATSEGGTASASATVRRDTAPPTLTCMAPEPVFELFQLGARVGATVTDATAGPTAPSAFGAANTGRAGSFTAAVVGTDRAGNSAMTTCPYRVIIPTCRGLSATLVGTGVNDSITGTTGRDVIVALGGADTVNGGGGADVICGGDGPDILDGAGGNDQIDGGASPDDIRGGTGDDVLDGGPQNDSLRGGNGRDTCTSGEVRMSSCEILR